jgi:hypothetical protein
MTQHTAGVGKRANYTRQVIGVTIQTSCYFEGKRYHEWLRPNQRMPISAHAEAGALLGEVRAATTHRKRIGEPVSKVICTLDDWAQSEYSYEELPNEVFYKLYCATRLKSFPRRIGDEKRDLFIANLRRVQEILLEHYPDCEPVQQLVERLNKAVKALEAWR